jgi:2-dehydro-3-deoxy-D-gluconate 5-dehydrogenase
MNAFDLSGKNALVTGSARGLGAAIALGLAEAGANVVCHGTKGDSAPVCDAIRKLGRKSGYVAANVATREACARLFDQALAQLGSIDILINNAGTIRRAAAAEHSEDFWNEVIAVNLNSVFWLSQLAGRHMLPRGSGKIVNIASLLSFQGGVTVPSYAAAKGGVAQLTKALANEWSSKGVNVNAIAPGYMETDNTAALRADPVRSRQIMERIPAGRWGKPADLAGAAIFLSSAASDYVHGHVLVVDGGWLAR